jgi:hypothetical protein
VSQEPDALGAVTWRRRHPILARGLLYGTGAILIAAAALALVARGKADRQDRLDYLAARLDALDVLAMSDHTGDEVEKVLDEVFADPDLPDPLRQLALRARSINHLKRSEAKAALADLDAAAALATTDVDRQAIGLERVQVLVSDQRAQEALTGLDGLEPSGHPALAIWRSVLRARALDDLGRRDDAVRALDDGLEALPRPLPDVAPVRFSLTPWTSSGAAVQATRSLVDLAPKPLGPGPWLRLLGLAPRDLVAAQEAAKALRQGGFEVEAARAWAWAVSLNDGRAPEDAASDPDLAALEKNRVEGLKAEVGGGR